MSNEIVEQSKSNRKTLIFILLVFALPSVFAILMYVSGWRPASTQNHGELILPVRHIPDRAMRNIDGESVQFFELHRKWTMIYFDSASCPDECMKQLYFMRQIHNSQGKNLDRIQRIFIYTGSDGLNTLKSKLVDYPNMLVWTTDQTELSKLRHDFGIELNAAVTERSIYLMDPQGNLMMRYATGIEPAGMRKDLERLLKYSSEK